MSSFLGLKELGAAAASGAEALSTWLSATMASSEPTLRVPASEVRQTAAALAAAPVAAPVAAAVCACMSGDSGWLLLGSS